ncbi:unnamed protein product, partial [Rotaria socialis]
PRLATKRRSIFFAQQHEENHLSLPWNHQSTTNDISLFFNDIPPSLSHSATTYHRTNSLTYHEHNPSDQYSSLLTEHHHSSI